MNITDSNFKIDCPLRLPEDEVQLWRVDLEAIGAEESRWQQVLSADERNRAARFHFARDRQHYTAARALLRLILAGYLGVEPTEIAFSYSKKEKPSLAPEHSASNLTFNLSHSGGVALYAFSRVREVGIDIELARRDFDVQGIARRFFSAHEQEQLSSLPADERESAFYRCWTRKESYVKATGDGLSLPLSQFDVSLERGSANALVATRPDPAEAARWLLREVPAGEGYDAAVCVRGGNWKLRSWD
jgi:4'-phosphopantetheinyl transferase